MATVARDGTGTTITYGTSAFAADVLSFDLSQTREPIDTTVMTTTGEMTSIPAKLIDPGELTMEIEHEGSQAPNISTALESIVIDWSGVGVGHKWTVNAYATSYSTTAEIGGRMQGSITLKLSGPIVIS